MLGPAETAGRATVLLASSTRRWRLFRKGAGDGSLPADSARATWFHAPTRSGARGKPPIDGKSVQDEATRFILDRYGPPGVVVDANLRNSSSFAGIPGRTSKPRPASRIWTSSRWRAAGCSIRCERALQTAKRRSRVVRKERVLVQRNGDWLEITLEVVPLMHVARRALPHAVRRVVVRRARLETRPPGAAERRRQRLATWTPESRISAASWPPAANTSSRASRSSRPPTRNCSQRTRKSCRATRSFKARTRSWTPRKKSCRARTKN